MCLSLLTPFCSDRLFERGTWFTSHLLMTIFLLTLGTRASADLDENVKKESSSKEEEATPAEKLATNTPKEKSTEDTKESDGHFGLAFGTGWIQDYPGADQGRTRHIILPLYKGTHFAIDRDDGAKGTLLRDQDYQFSFSFSFLFPTEAEDIPVRQGMSDIDWTLQFGPEIIRYLYQKKGYSVYVRLPLRVVFSTDFHSNFDDQGLFLAPSLRTEIPLPGDWGSITTRMELNFATQEYNAYFYQVDQEFATSDRAAYEARAGYLESILGLTYVYEESFPFSFFVSANAYFLGDSVNKESPLFVDSRNYSILGALIYYF